MYLILIVFILCSSYLFSLYTLDDEILVKCFVNQSFFGRNLFKKSENVYVTVCVTVFGGEWQFDRKALAKK